MLGEIRCWSLFRIHVQGLTRLLPESSIQLGSPSFDYSCDVDSVVVINVWVICTTTNAEPKSSCTLEKNKKGVIFFLYITKKYHYMQCHNSVESHCATASNKRLPPIRKTEVAWLRC